MSSYLCDDEDDDALVKATSMIYAQSMDITQHAVAIVVLEDSKI